MPREFLRVTPETTPGTFNAGGTHSLIDLDQANAYTLRPKPILVEIRTAGGNNLRATQVGRKENLNGNLNWLLHGSQAALFVDWCCAKPDGTLPSYTVDHCLMMEDPLSTLVYSRTLGVYVGQAGVTASEQNQVVRANLQLVGTNVATITTTDFPTPVPADFANDPILTFEDATGGLMLGGTARLDIENFDLTIKNLIDVKFFLGKYPLKLRYCGRDVDWTSRLQFASMVPRNALTDQTQIAASIAFDNGTNSLSFDMHGKNYFSDVADQIDHGKVFLQQISMKAFVDPATGTELTATAT
jgi:hypothetical protein